MPLRCPHCMGEYPPFSGTCPHCGADLAYLIQHPARARLVIWSGMWLGLALIGVVFVDLLYQALDGAMPRLLGVDAWLFGVGVFLSVLSARAWRWLKHFVRARLQARSQESEPEEALRKSA